jgi:uncharacterized protein YdeI (YjbR/CyaY-like superfamily)
MARAAETLPQVTIRSRADLRAWLAEHHASSGTVWLCIHKKPSPDHVPYAAAVEELLCWGWIDSVPRSLDAERSLLMIAPRNPKSAWSAINKAHVNRARASGAMTPAGEAKIAIAMASGQWDFLNDVDALIVPDDLALALTQKAASSVWDTYPRSIKRGTLEFIKTARTAATRAARIEEVSSSAAQGLRPKNFRR